jgi:hypothetical protein
LKKDIENYIPMNLQMSMDIAETNEKNRERIECRKAFTAHDIEWLSGKDSLENLACIGAINR